MLSLNEHVSVDSYRPMLLSYGILVVSLNNQSTVLIVWINLQ